MKKQVIDLDFIGGLGSLTEEEAMALAKYFAEKKKKSPSQRQIPSKEIDNQRLHR